uniref:TlpA family protein disulfide reductase n=1 Tax=Pedobacter schmidteae TaxID=2201271 RepID=UPI0018D52675|nr:TlpA disulfide reductase family protein [Pedobacter schmidteae]
MKTYCTFFAMLLGSFLNVKAQETEIKGTSKTTKPDFVKLFSVKQGQMVEIASVKPAANGTFDFKFKPTYKGYYLVGFGNANSGTQDKYKLYVQGNDQINLDLTDTSYILKGKNNKENLVLEQWYKTAYKLERKTIYFNRGPRSFKDFFPMLEETVAKSKPFSAGINTGNSDFDRLMRQTIAYDLGYYTLTLLLYPTASKPHEEDFTPYVKNFNADDFLQNEVLLQFPYGLNMLGNLVSFKNKNLGYDFDKNVLSIPNDQLKGDYALTYAGFAKSYNKYKEIVDTYGKYFTRADQKLRAESIEAKNSVYKPGAKAFNFTFPDVNGKLVSLNDFKGKVVLVDVWATWCGPCVKEIPSLKKLEEAFHGKDVAFLSVSVDDQKDKEKWRKFVADEQLGGVQLHAGPGSEVSKNYKISGIPRFMLFDKNGNIIDVDSARPSDPKLKETLNEWLNK